MSGSRIILCSDRRAPLFSIANFSARDSGESTKWAARAEIRRGEWAPVHSRVWAVSQNSAMTVVGGTFTVVVCWLICRTTSAQISICKNVESHAPSAPGHPHHHESISPSRIMRRRFSGQVKSLCRLPQGSAPRSASCILPVTSGI